MKGSKQGDKEKGDWEMIDEDVFFDASERTDEELLQTFARAAESSEWNDPSMDIYDDYDYAKK
ncbi:MAG: hypothetical protein WD065_14900 [Planctomycetaceae bacterium]